MADAPVSLDALYRVARLLDEARRPYAFIGGIAVSTWAVPRATFDLDVALEVLEPEIPALLERFDQSGFIVDPQFRAGFTDRVGGMDKIHVLLPVGVTSMSVDLFLATTPFVQSVLTRRVAVELGKGPVHVCSAADLLLFKLVAWRPKDRVDIENLLTVQGMPDPDYVASWAERLGVTPRWREIRPQ